MVYTNHSDRCSLKKNFGAIIISPISYISSESHEAAVYTSTQLVLLQRPAAQVCLSAALVSQWELHF